MRILKLCSKNHLVSTISKSKLCFKRHLFLTNEPRSVFLATTSVGRGTYFVNRTADLLHIRNFVVTNCVIENQSNGVNTQMQIRSSKGIRSERY